MYKLFDGVVGTIDDLLAAHQACRGHLADSAEALKRGLETGDALGLRLETLYSYAHLKSDEDLANGKNAGRRDRHITVSRH